VYTRQSQSRNQNIATTKP